MFWIGCASLWGLILVTGLPFGSDAWPDTRRHPRLRLLLAGGLGVSLPLLAEAIDTPTWVMLLVIVGLPAYLRRLIASALHTRRSLRPR